MDLENKGRKDFDGSVQKGFFILTVDSEGLLEKQESGRAQIMSEGKI